MFTGYSIAPLGPEQVQLALPLAQIANASLTAERWQEFSREIADTSPGPGTNPATGLMAVRNRRGYFIALFRYDVLLTLRQGRTLVIHDLVVADEELHAGAMATIGKAIRDLAKAHRCSGIEVAMPGGLSATSYLRQLADELGPPLEAATCMRASWPVEAAPGS